MFEHHCRESAREGDDSEEQLTVVVAVNNESVFRSNVLASPIWSEPCGHELMVQRGFRAAGLAYNNAIERAAHDLIVLMHQDVYLPGGWVQRLRRELSLFERTGIQWGVLGCYGISMEGRPAGHVYSNGLQRELGYPQTARRVQSLDELLIIIRKRRGLRFDPMLPYFHLFGTDLCLSATQMNLENYVISNLCVHNSLPVRRLPQHFWYCAEYVRDKWKEQMPVKTCCVTLGKNKMSVVKARLLTQLRFIKNEWQAKPHRRLEQPSHIADAILQKHGLDK